MANQQYLTPDFLDAFITFLLDELKPKHVSVLFEMSKNYLMLKKFFEAEEFAKQALAIEPDNYWILEHLLRYESFIHRLRNF